MTLTLSKAMSKVPGVVGRSVEEATRLLEQAGYTVTLGEVVANEKLAKGLVAVQSPEGGSQLNKQQSVLIQPSAGPDTVEVPKLVGMALVRARATIEEAGLKLGGVSWLDHPNLRSFAVVRQDPKPGSQAKPGASVELAVNREQ